MSDDSIKDTWETDCVNFRVLIDQPRVREELISSLKSQLQRDLFVKE